MTEQNHATVRRFDGVDGFLVVDLPGADSADGLVRCARKVLVDSTKALARSRSYSWALLEQRISGASGAVNATGEDIPTSLAAFAGALAPEVGAGALTLAAGKGTTAESIQALGAVVQPDPSSFAAGMVAAIAAVTGGDLSNTSVAVEFEGDEGATLLEALGTAGADVSATGDDAWSAEADVLLFGSRAGVLDHERAASLPQRILVPTSALAFTPRALAVANRADKLVLPDFLTMAGPLAARAGLDPAERIGALVETVIASDQGAVLGACLLAEEYLSTWCTEMPFGRPIG